MVDEQLSLLVKPVSADCNMRCAYCFYRRENDPYRLGEPHLMDDRTLRQMIAGYMKSAGAAASFGWQGGEPLLAGIDFFRRVVAYQQECGLSGQLVSNNLQTNGLLIDRAWAAFFRKYRFFIGVSLDGPEEVHNRYRVSTNGENGFRRTMEGIGILKEQGVDFSILAVVNEATARIPRELYAFFLTNGLDRLQFIPCLEVDRDDGRVKPFSVTAAEYCNFLCGLFDVWYNQGRPVASIRLFENILAVYLGVEPEICAFKGRCGSYAVVEYNGDVYPCDFFVEAPWVLGNLRETPLTELAKKRRRRDFNNRKLRTVSGCSRCEWNFLCHYGCQHYRSPAGENVFCAAYREFFRYTEQRFKRLKEEIV
jgi:uncharacterized protein